MNAQNVELTKAWRERMIRLNESAFLDVMRNYLGEISTPYHKQEILGRLESFLRDVNVLSRLVQLLGAEDVRLLSAVALLPSPTEAQIFRIFSGSPSHLELHMKLLELEDRLLIWKHDQGIFRICPYLDEILRPKLSMDYVLGQGSRERDFGSGPEDHSRFMLDFCGVGAMITFLAKHQSIMTSSGKPKRKVMDEFETVFAPAFRDDDQVDTSEQLLGLVSAAFLRTGILIPKGLRWAVDHFRLYDLAAFTEPDAGMFLLAAAVYPDPEELVTEHRTLSPSYEARITQFTAKLRAWFELIEPGLWYDQDALAARFIICSDAEVQIGRILSDLVVLGVLRKRARRYALNTEAPIFSNALPGAEAVLGSDGMLNVPKNSDLDTREFFTFALASTLVRYDTVSQFRIDKRQFFELLRRGISCDDFTGTVRKLCRQRSSEALELQIAEWNNEYSSVRAIDGIVLVARPPKHLMLAHLPELAPYILEQPAENVFVMDRYQKESWESVLSEAGIEAAYHRDPFEMPATPRQEGEDLGWREVSAQSKTKLSYPVMPGLSPGLESPRQPLRPQFRSVELSPGIGPESPGTEKESPAQAILEEHMAALDNLALTNHDVIAEFRWRIRRRIIVVPAQIQPNSVRLEKTEARGLDFHAKHRLIELVITEKRDYLQLTVADSSRVIVVLPKSLKILRGEAIVDGITIPDATPFSLPLRNVLSVKRMRSSLFATQHSAKI